MRMWNRWMLAATTALLVACGGSPADTLFSVQEKALSIVEDNKADANKAADELEKYLKDKQEDVAKAVAELEAMETKDPAKMKELEAKFKAKSEEIEARWKKLLTENPALGENERIARAMRMMN